MARNEVSSRKRPARAHSLEYLELNALEFSYQNPNQNYRYCFSFPLSRCLWIQRGNLLRPRDARFYALFRQIVVPRDETRNYLFTSHSRCRDGVAERKRVAVSDGNSSPATTFALALRPRVRGKKVGENLSRTNMVELLADAERKVGANRKFARFARVADQSGNESLEGTGRLSMIYLK